MTKNGTILSVVALLLAGIYIFVFSDWFSHGVIQITPAIRPTRPQGQRDPTVVPVYPVSFGLYGKHRLTSVKVVSASEFATNKYARPLWHMISDGGSAPTKVVVYGLSPKGMKPAIPRARPDPLEPNVPYVLFVEAGKIKGQTNFFTREIVHAAVAR